MSAATYRRAHHGDAAAINEIYNPYISTSSATFETKPYSLAARYEWFAARDNDPRHPVIIAEEAGLAVGFASASAFDPRQGYATSVKTSVFLSPDAAGRGIGTGLYGALFSALAGTGLHRAYGLVVPPNPASEALHRRFGFRHVSTLSEVGRKFDRYYDVMWFEKAL